MLSGKSALVTGSTSGIGLAIATLLARHGANVMLHGLGDPAEIADLRARIQRETVATILYSDADMNCPSDIRTLTHEAVRAFGSVDILVNNAGVQHVAPITSFPTEKWDQILAINLSAAFHAIQGCIGGMIDKGWGRIINIASAHGVVASAYKSAYVASKHGLIGLTKSVALETAELGITCNAVCPGYVLTPLVERQVDDQAKAHAISRDEVIGKVMLDRQPTKKFVSVDQVAELCLFLCGNASSSITGSSLSIDGGWTAQ